MLPFSHAFGAFKEADNTKTQYNAYDSNDTKTVNTKPKWIKPQMDHINC